MDVFYGRPWFLSNRSGSGMQNLDGPFPIRLNEWTHLAATFDCATKRLYVNGKVQSVGIHQA